MRKYLGCLELGSLFPSPLSLQSWYCYLLQTRILRQASQLLHHPSLTFSHHHLHPQHPSSPFPPVGSYQSTLSTYLAAKEALIFWIGWLDESSWCASFNLPIDTLEISCHCMNPIIAALISSNSISGQRTSRWQNNVPRSGRMKQRGRKESENAGTDFISSL